MQFNETKTEIFQADEKTKLLVRIWLPPKTPKAIFLAIHGGMAHAGDFVTPAAYFTNHDIALYAPDLRWHGTYPQYNRGGKVFFHTPSYDIEAHDVQNFYYWVRDMNPGVPIFIFAHSNGALISLYYGLTIGKTDDIAGYILSSPWLMNRVAVNPAIVALSKVLAVVHPKLAVTPEPLTDVLTHDPKITARHHADEASGIRGTQATAKLGVESGKTQAWVRENLIKWEKFPLFTVIAGEDRLADADVNRKLFGELPRDLVTVLFHEKNYHENFNEINREDTYNAVMKWIKPHMK